MISPLDVLVDDAHGDEPAATGLLRTYGGPLVIDRTAPRVIANFVATPDGVVTFGRGASAVSMNSDADHFVMCLLRASSDAIMVGAGTVRAGRGQWTPWSPFPAIQTELEQYRETLTGTPEPPPLVVVTAAGDLPEGHAALVAPECDVLIITTAKGAKRLPRIASRVSVATLAEDGHLEAGAILGCVRAELGATVVLTEAGPHLFSQLLAAHAVDELFLTVAPQLAGRLDGDERLTLVTGTAFLPADTPRLQLRSLRRAESLLFLRYAVS